MTAGLCLFVALFLFVNKADAYAASNSWTFGSTNQLTVTYATDTDTATISGSGAMDGRPFETVDGLSKKGIVKRVVIESGVIRLLRVVVTSYLFPFRTLLFQSVMLHFPIAQILVNLPFPIG